MKNIDSIIKKIIKEETNNKIKLEEDLFDPLKNIKSGVKGFFRGEGYSYYKYLSQLENLSRDLKRLDKPNHKIMEKLKQINTEIQNSRMSPAQKQNITTSINSAVNHFEQYSNYIDSIENAIKMKLS